VSDISSTYSAGYFVVLRRTVIKPPVSQKMFKLFTHVTLSGGGGEEIQFNNAEIDIYAKMI
jgi:hypothetical protein